MTKMKMMPRDENSSNSDDDGAGMSPTNILDSDFVSGTKTNGLSTSHEITPPPDITSIRRAEIGRLDFSVGPDTCGFTSNATFTCDVGVCTNVGSHRNCCEDDMNCSETIKTACASWQPAQLASRYCGAYTLCCEPEAPFCVHYVFTTKALPGQTLTHWACDPSAALNGELFPFPPELMTTPTGSLVVHPTTQGVSNNGSTSDGSSNQPVAVGTIVGASVGALLILLLGIVGAVLVARRQRQKREMQGASESRNADVDSDDNVDPLERMPEAGGAAGTRRSRRLRLSTIPEQPSPVSDAPASANRKGLFRRSYGPHWLLGSSDPLDSHPVDLEKQLSEPSIPVSNTVIPAAAHNKTVPQLNMPTAPTTITAARSTSTSPATATTPPTASQQQTSPLRSPQQPPTQQPSSSRLQSPRLSCYVPVSPIHATFNDESHGSVSPIESVMSIDNRISFISKPSLPGDDDDADGEGDDLVSPISPDAPSLPSVGGGRVSPALTVSPIESRRGSVAPSWVVFLHLGV